MAAALQDSVEFLFKPGAGSMPPVLAGRKKEKKALDHFRRALLRGEKIESDVVLYGPRGNGKTVLLDAFRESCVASSGAGVADDRFLEKSASDLKSVEALRHALLPPGFRAEMERTLKDARSARVGPLEMAFGNSARPGLSDALFARLADGKPLVLTIDEAHRLPVDVGSDLLNASRSVRRRGLPFLLVLAGTPDLKARLGQMQASFWGRSEIIPVGRISAKEAKRALTDPLDALGVGFGAGALAVAAADMVGYPYFTQLWGRSLADAKGDFDRSPRVSAADAVAASRLFAGRRWHYYDQRYSELDNLGILGPAETVARAWKERGIQSRTHLRAIVGAALADGAAGTAMEVADHLLDLGFVWDGGGQAEDDKGEKIAGLDAGIPSLMDHVLERAPAPKTDPAALVDAEPDEQNPSP